MISPFAAMRYSGVTREDFKKLDKKGRLLLWMLVCFNIALVDPME